MILPIDLVPGTNPPCFRWRQAVTAPSGEMLMVDHEGTLPQTVEVEVAALIALAKCQQQEIASLRQVGHKLETDRDKLQAFKDWVHAYLDEHGVPHHPPGPHGAEGCRIGDRMDWLMDKIKGLEAEATAKPMNLSTGRRKT